MEYDLSCLPSRLESALKSAIKAAESSTEDMRHGACLFNTKPIISAPNEAGTHSVASPFRLYAVNSRHAECNCISKHGSAKGLSILVVRLDKFGKLRNSKPCEMCNSFMAHNGIRHCYYSTETSIVAYQPKTITVYNRKFDHHPSIRYSRYDYAS